MKWRPEGSGEITDDFLKTDHPTCGFRLTRIAGIVFVGHEPARAFVDEFKEAQPEFVKEVRREVIFEDGVLNVDVEVFAQSGDFGEPPGLG